MGVITYLHNDGRECKPDPETEGYFLVDIPGANGGASGVACLRAHPDVSEHVFTTVTDLRTCQVKIERVYQKLWKHRLQPFANAAGGRCSCGGFVMRQGGDVGESLWYVHLAVAVGGCAS